MNSLVDKFSSLCKLISETFDLSVYFIDCDGMVTCESLNHHSLNPLYKNEKQKLFELLQFDPKSNWHFPNLKKTAFFENYLLISIFDNTIFKGTVLVGPSIFLPISKEKINGIINDTQALFLRESVFNYYDSLPVLSSKKLVNIGSAVSYMLNQEIVSPETIIRNNQKFTQPIKKNEKIHLSISENFQERVFHHNPMLEKERLSIIKEGRVTEVKNFFDMVTEEMASVLSKSSYIRSMKNHIISLITLVSRAAIDGGLNSEYAYTMSDTYIQRVEELTQVDEIKKLASEVLNTFTIKVSEIKTEQYSKTVITCKNYIYNHLYEEINHNDIAKAVELNPKYLSTLFKKEVGIPVSEYVQQTKINEAKKLLTLSNTPISEICSLLHFSDQSYFTKVFKKFTSVTPKRFREMSHLMEK